LLSDREGETCQASTVFADALSVAIPPREDLELMVERGGKSVLQCPAQ
jgi:hypothetical protein